jgi:serralysin
MMYDIAALQHMYGADFSTNSGNTTYSWTPDNGQTRVDGEVAIDPGANRIFATIWDGGGKDTYDLSSYRTDLDINLNPGKHSTFREAQLAFLGGGPNDGDARGNIFNALLNDDDERSLIENATGGGGDDEIKGNDAPNKLRGGDGDDVLNGGKGKDKLIGEDGGDTLTGGKGKDELQGGDGSDIFRFRSVKDSVLDDPDTIRQGNSDVAFEGVGRSGGDLIDLSRIDADKTRSDDQSFDLDDSKDTGSVWLRTKNAVTYVQANVDDDAKAEFRLKVFDGEIRHTDYTADDFIL